MRVLVLLLAVLLGCSYEYNYYGAGDGGIVDGGEVIMPQSIFSRDSKLQGNAVLNLQPAPPAPAAGQPWVDVFESNARQGAQTLITLETADQLPHVVTVSMGYVGPLPAFIFDGGVYSTELVAILEIGIGGISVLAEVDFIDGFQFSLACSRLQVHAVYRLVPGGVVAIPVGVNRTIQAAVSVSTGTVAHARAPQRTLGSIVPLAPNAFELYRIPSFAKSVRVSSATVNTTPTIQLWNSEGINTQVFAVAGYPSADLPIGNGSRVIVFWNTSLINDVSRRLIFELAL